MTTSIYLPKKNSPNQPDKTFKILFYGINHSRILFGIHTDINYIKVSLIYFRINEMALRAPLISYVWKAQVLNTYYAEF